MNERQYELTEREVLAWAYLERAEEYGCEFDYDKDVGKLDTDNAFSSYDDNPPESWRLVGEGIVVRRKYKGNSSVALESVGLKGLETYEQRRGTFRWCTLPDGTTGNCEDAPWYRYVIIGPPVEVPWYYGGKKLVRKWIEDEESLYERLEKLDPWAKDVMNDFIEAL